jgi:hypothetical protein
MLADSAAVAATVLLAILPGFVALIGVCSWWSRRCDLLLEEAHEYRMFAFKCSVVAAANQGESSRGDQITLGEPSFGFGSVNDDQSDDDGSDDPANRRRKRS